MTIIRHKNGVALPGPGFNKRSIEKYLQPNEKERAVLRAVTSQWEAPITIINRAGIADEQESYRLLKRMALKGRIERRVVPSGNGFYPQYKRTVNQRD